jgi:type II secretory pathway component PulF
MLFTPGQFARRADFYHQLGQLTAAGLPLPVALRQLHRAPPSRAFKPFIGQMLVDLEAGATVSESFGRRRDLLPEFDIALLHAGERSGRLVQTFTMLTDFYQSRATLARRILGALAYPVFLLHGAIFILPFPELFLTGNFPAYLLKTVGVLVPLYGLALLAVFLSQGNRGRAWRSTFEKIIAWVPLVGAGRRKLALARTAAALEALINAGETIDEAWPLAAAASGSPALERTVETWRPGLAMGQTPAELVQASSLFPETFANLYTSGEISGSLDETLHRLHRYYADEGTSQLQMAARVGPAILYGLVAAYIAWQVIQFWTGYFNQINQVMGG